MGGEAGWWRGEIDTTAHTVKDGVVMLHIRPRCPDGLPAGPTTVRDDVLRWLQTPAVVSRAGGYIDTGTG